MGFLLKAAFWLGLVFVVFKIDLHDGQDRSRLVATASESGTEAIRTKASELGGQAVKACLDKPDVCARLARSAGALGAAAPTRDMAALAEKPSQHTLTPADLAPNFALLSEEPAPALNAAPAPKPALPHAAPLPLPRKAG
jgi:hypothetical protein